MLRNLKELERFKVKATDGDIGSVENFLLDDERWTVRYLVVDTVRYLDGRHVLISPISFRPVDWPGRRFQVALTMAKIEHCPDIDMDRPVSRQHEDDFNQYYGYPDYWAYSGLWGTGSNPAMIAAKREEVAVARAVALTEQLSFDIHLRSTSELRGYHIEGSDGAIGHVADFIVADDSWAVRYLVIETGSWWSSKKVLLAPQWASRVSWKEQAVFVELSRDLIRDSPEWDPDVVIDRAYEARLHDHFGRPPYWTGDGHPEPAEAPHNT
jgi:hypothetical protein